MKKGKKNNAFTDALGEELLTRKIFEKTTQKIEDAHLISEIENDFEPEFENKWLTEPIEPTKPVAQKKVSEQSKPNKKVKTKVKKKKVADKKDSSVQKVADKKISSPQKVEPDSEFEKRIFAEADNNFFDEKIPQNIGDNMRSNITEKISENKEERPVFHSKFFRKQLAEVEKENLDAEEESQPDFDPELHKKLSRAELAGVGISAAMMVYAFINLDKPLFFLALSLFTHLMRPLVGSLCGKYNRAVQNAMRSFSLVLFVGAIIFLIMIL